MKKNFVIAVICVAAILVAVGLYGLVNSYQAFQELRVAKSLIYLARDSLDKRDIESAAARFVKAQEHIKVAAARLEDHKLSVGILKIIPYVGTHIKALDSFVQVGTHLSKAGTLLTGVVRGVPGVDATVAQGSMSIGAMVDTLARLGNDLAPVEEELLAARKESRSVKTGWLIGYASRMKAEMDEKLDGALNGLQKARRLMAVFPAIMGAQGQPPKSYLLLQQSIYELRASGGLISTYGLLQCSYDSLRVTEYQRSSTLKGGLAHEEIIPPLPPLGGWLAAYGIGEPVLQFWDGGWWPDFPRTADELSKIWARNGKAPVDGYIGIDQIAMEYVLEQVGPIKVPEFGETVTADNLVALILKYYELGKKTEFLKSLAERFYERVIGSDPGQWVSIGRAFSRALAEKHMLLYFKDPEIQQCFTESGWSGEVDRSDGDYLMAVDSNVGGNDIIRSYKSSMWINSRMSVKVTRRKDSKLSHHVKYTFEYNPGPYEKLPLEYKSYLRLYVPEGAVIEGAVARAASGFVVSSSDSGKQVFGKLVNVPLGGTRTVEFDYVTPGYGSMLIQKQSGQTDLDIEFVYLEGGSIKQERQFKLVNKLDLDLSR